MLEPRTNATKVSFVIGDSRRPVGLADRRMLRRSRCPAGRLSKAGHHARAPAHQLARKQPLTIA
jgi:hypothetical protein